MQDRETRDRDLAYAPGFEPQAVRAILAFPHAVRIAQAIEQRVIVRVEAPAPDQRASSTTKHRVLAHLILREQHILQCVGVKSIRMRVPNLR